MTIISNVARARQLIAELGPKKNRTAQENALLRAAMNYLSGSAFMLPGVP